MKKNSDLKKIYNKAYRKGEKKHYTRLLLSKGKLTNDKRAVLDLISWKGKKVLDVGCGTGEMASLIAKKGATVVGIDYSPEAIALALSAHRHTNLEFRVADLKQIKEKYDVIISLGTLEHTDNPFVTLRSLATHVKKGGSLILTCPNWLNPRGYILQTLWHLFRAKITLADIHYLTPLEFEQWAKKLRMRLSWKTVDHDWAHGSGLVVDFKRRIPNVLRDSDLPSKKEYIDGFIQWIETHISVIEQDTPFGGVTGVYHLKK